MYLHLEHGTGACSSLTGICDPELSKYGSGDRGHGNHLDWWQLYQWWMVTGFRARVWILFYFIF